MKPKGEAMETRKYNKALKYVALRFMGSLLRSFRLLWRYMQKRIFTLVTLLIPLIAFSQEMTANQAVKYWSERFRDAIPSYSFDYELDEWASRHGINFEIVKPQAGEPIQGKYLYQATLGKYKVKIQGWECDHHLVVLKVWLNEFKQSGSYGIHRKSACNHGSI